MQLSTRTQKLILISCTSLLLVSAAIDGKKEVPILSKPTIIETPNNRIRIDIDPQALEYDGPTTVVSSLSIPVSQIAKPKPVRSPDVVSAEAYAIANLETGEFYKGHNIKQVFPIASVSKLVTGLTALHSMNLGNEVVITETMLEAYGDAGKLEQGEVYTVSELLYPLILESSNDAAEAIAYSYGYDSFIQKMNAFVRQLDMKSTSFKDASGLSSGNISSVEDLFLLARYIYTKEPEFLELSRMPGYSVSSSTRHAAKVWKSINPFPYDPHFLGGKTGRTLAAKESMISLFRYEANGVVYPVAIIVLRADFDTREMDSSLLLEQFIRTVDTNL